MSGISRLDRFENFLLYPEKCATSRRGKDAMIALDVIFGIATFGLVHLGFYLRHKFSSKPVEPIILHDTFTHTTEQPESISQKSTQKARQEMDRKVGTGRYISELHLKIINTFGPTLASGQIAGTEQMKELAKLFGELDAARTLCPAGTNPFFADLDNVEKKLRTRYSELKKVE
jgi:hypothetical protein